MKDFYCQFDSDQDKRFSLENRLVFAEASPEEKPEPKEKDIHDIRRGYLNEHLDIFDNLQQFPATEHEFIAEHLARNVARYKGENVVDFYTSGQSEKILGFSYDPEENVYQIKDSQSPTGYKTEKEEGLADFIKNNLLTLAAKSGIEVEKGSTAAELAQATIDATAEGQEQFKWLEGNYAEEGFDALKNDLEEVRTLRKVVRLGVLKEKVKVVSTAKLDVLMKQVDFETKFEIMRAHDPVNEVEAALLWVAINRAPEMKYEELDIDSIFDVDFLEKNKIGLKNGRLVAIYKANDSKNEDTAYDHATYAYGLAGLRGGIEALKDSNNKFADANVADLLRQGVDIYRNFVIETKSYDTNEKFQENFALLNRILQIQEKWWNNVDVSDLDLPEFMQDSDKEWYFMNVNGEYYARTMNLVEGDEFYKFDETAEKGWKKVPQPVSKLAIPELYRKRGNKYEVNQEALNLMARLGIDPRTATARTLNVMYEENGLSNEFLNTLINQPLLPLPFPALDKFELLLDKENFSNSVSSLQAYLYKAYSEYLPGLKPAAAKKLAPFISRIVLETVKNKGKDDNGKEIDNKHKYLISCDVMNDFSMAFNPEHFITEFTVEKELSERAMAHIAELTAWKEKIQSMILRRFSFGGGFFKEILTGVMDATLDEVWGDVELMAEEWGEMEESKGKELSILTFFGAKLGDALGKSIRGEQPFEEGSLLAKLFKRGDKADEAAKKKVAEAIQRQSFDVSDPLQLEVVGENMKARYVRLATQPQGKPIFDEVDLLAMVKDIRAKYENKPFTPANMEKIALKKMKEKVDAGKLEKEEFVAWRDMKKRNQEAAKEAREAQATAKKKADEATKKKANASSEFGAEGVEYENHPFEGSFTVPEGKRMTLRIKSLSGTTIIKLGSKIANVNNKLEGRPGILDKELPKFFADNERQLVQTDGTVEKGTYVLQEGDKIEGNFKFNYAKVEKT